MLPAVALPSLRAAVAAAAPVCRAAPQLLARLAAPQPASSTLSMRQAQQLLRACRRSFATEGSAKPAPKRTSGGDKNKSLSSAERPFSELTVAEKVVERGKDVGSVGVIALGFGLAGVFLYSVLSELFFVETPNDVQDKAFKLVIENDDVHRLMGDDIKIFGQKRSGRRGGSVPEHVVYEVQGIEYMRMKFYVEGSLDQGTVQLEMKKPKDSNSKYTVRYLFVDMAGKGMYGPRRVVLQDNRSDDKQTVAGTA